MEEKDVTGKSKAGRQKMGKETRNRQLRVGWGGSRRRGVEEELKRNDRVCSDTEEQDRIREKEKHAIPHPEGAVLTVSTLPPHFLGGDPNFPKSRNWDGPRSLPFWWSVQDIAACVCVCIHTHLCTCVWMAMCLGVHMCAYLYIKAYMLIYTPLQITQRKQTAVYSCGLGHRCSSDSIPCLETCIYHRYS